MAPVKTVETKLATVREVAEHLSICRSKVYMLMDAGDLSYVKLGKSRRVKWADVDRLAQAATVNG